MSTSGHFTPPDPCPTEPMTRAALVALRDAGELVEGCHYVISDHVQAPNLTGPNLVELHAVAPGVLSMEAKVSTPYDAVAWAGLYDVDLGTGTLLELKDNRGNIVRDSGDGSTVGAFPWGAVNFTHNEVIDSTLTGWSAMTGTVANNIIRRANVDLTGNWTEVIGNEIQAATTAALPIVLLGGGTGTRVFNGNRVRDAAVFRSNTGSTGTRTITDNEFLDAYVIDIAATATGNVTIDGSRLESHGTSGTDCVIDGSGGRTLNNIRGTAPTGLGQVHMTLVGPGAVGLDSSEFANSRITRDPATAASLSINQGSSIQNGLISQGPAATGATSISATRMQGALTLVNHLGAGNLTISQSMFLAGTATMGAGATRSLTVTSSIVKGGNILQSRTGGTGVDQVTNSYVEGTGDVITLAGAVNPGSNQIPVQTSRIAGGTLTLTDPVGSGTGLPVLQNSEISSGAAVTGTGTLLISGCRFAAGAQVNVGAFSHSATIIEGGIVKTLTANNANRLANKSFDDAI